MFLDEQAGEKERVVPVQIHNPLRVMQRIVGLAGLSMVHVVKTAEHNWMFEMVGSYQQMCVLLQKLRRIPLKLQRLEVSANKRKGVKVLLVITV